MPKDIHPYTVLRRPIITEKSTELADSGKYVFEVDPRANKFQIKEAVMVSPIRTLGISSLPISRPPACGGPPA